MTGSSRTRSSNVPAARVLVLTLAGCAAVVCSGLVGAMLFGSARDDASARAQTTSDGQYQALLLRTSQTTSRVLILDTRSGDHWIAVDTGSSEFTYEGPSKLPRE